MEDEMTDGIEIQPFSQETLSKDILGDLIRKLALIAYAAFREPPWDDKFGLPRLHFGLGVDLMCRNARAYLAKTESGLLVGYILGYEVLLEVQEDPRDLTLHTISGTEDLNYLFEDGQRVFYGDTLCVHHAFRRQSIGETLAGALIEELRRQGFTYYIGRTHSQANAPRGLLGKLGFEELPIRDREYPDRTYWVLRL